jgi:hypothetical protein
MRSSIASTVDEPMATGGVPSGKVRPPGGRRTLRHVFGRLRILS